MDHLLTILVNDPVKYALAILTLGIYFLFKSYDKRVDEAFQNHRDELKDSALGFTVKLDSHKKDFEKFMEKTTKDIEIMKNDWVKNSNTLKEDLMLLKTEIKLMSDRVNIEIKALKTLYLPEMFTEKLAEYDEKLSKLNENYGKVILIEDKIKNQRELDLEDINKRIVSISKEIGKIRNK